jgi:broad specificity phosphatase PhoE
VLRLTLVRHASTAWNEAGRYQGWGDPPLSERGRAEALDLRARLAGEAFDRVVASDLARAVETARIALADEVAVQTDARLRELGFGAWEGLTWSDCVARDGDLVRRWVADPAACTPPDGEPAVDFQERVGAALDGLGTDGSVLCVTHAGVIHAALARWMGVDLRHTFALRLSPCGITRAEVHPGGARVLCVNDGTRLPAHVPVDGQGRDSKDGNSRRRGVWKRP